MKLSGEPLGFMVIFGLLSLAGIIVNNAVLLLERIEAELREGQSPRAAVINAAVKRLRPIVMTKLTCITGLVPLLLFAGPLVGHGGGHHRWTRPRHAGHAGPGSGALRSALQRAHRAPAQRAAVGARRAIMCVLIAHGTATDARRTLAAFAALGRHHGVALGSEPHLHGVRFASLSSLLVAGLLLGVVNSVVRPLLIVIVLVLPWE